MRNLQAFLKRDFLNAGGFTYLQHWTGAIASLFFWYYLMKLSRPLGSVDSSPLAPGNFTYTLVGFALMQFVWRGFSVFAGRLKGEQASGVLSLLRLTPHSLPCLLLLSGVWDFLSAAVGAALILVLGVYGLGAHLSGGQIAGILGIGILVSIGMASLGLLPVSWTLATARTDPLGPLAGQLMTLLSGAFFPSHLLPGWFGWLSSLLPITHAVTLARWVSGTVGAAAAAPAAVGLAATTVLSIVVGVLLLRVALHSARISGKTLGLS